jgi:hypothetical protein
MDDEIPDPETDFHEGMPRVPPVLHSVFNEGPFRKCDACGVDLAEGADAYQLQKTWKQDEVVFEIALCVPCLMKTMRDFSEESMERIRRFHLERFRPTPDLDRCHFCRKAVGPENEYEVGAICSGEFLARPPVVMCGDCSSKLQENLSNKTRDAWGEFLDQNVPGVPLELEPDRLPLAF